MAQQRFVLFVPETDIVELHVLDGDEASERIALLFLIALEGIDEELVVLIMDVDHYVFEPHVAESYLAMPQSQRRKLSVQFADISQGVALLVC